MYVFCYLEKNSGVLSMRACKLTSLFSRLLESSGIGVKRKSRKQGVMQCMVNILRYKNY